MPLLDEQRSRMIANRELPCGYFWQPGVSDFTQIPHLGHEMIEDSLA
jgi:hypothetical protein